MSRAPKSGRKKKGRMTFVIDCGKPMEDKIMDIASLEKFRQERIKVVGGKVRDLHGAVTVAKENSRSGNFTCRTKMPDAPTGNSFGDDDRRPESPIKVNKFEDNWSSSRKE